MSKSPEQKFVTLSRARRSGVIGLATCGLALGLLLVATVFAVQARERLLETRAALSMAQIDHRQAQSRLAMVDRRRELDQSVAKVVDHALGEGLDPNQWVESNIEFRRQGMTRTQVNQMLLTTALRRDQIVEISQFDLSATSPNEGLFTPVADREGAVQLSLRATRMLKTEEND